MTVDRRRRGRPCRRRTAPTSCRCATSARPTARTAPSSTCRSGCPTGGVVALVGSNGAGKSTVARTVTGLVTASAGQVLFSGQDVTDAPGLQDRPARHGARGRGARRVLEPDRRGEPDAGLPPAGRAGASSRRTSSAPTRPFPSSGNGGARSAGTLSGASSACSRWPRSSSCRPRSSWPTSCPWAWLRSSSTRSTRDCGRSIATAPRWSWSSSRSTGCSSWRTGPSCSTTAASPTRATRPAPAQAVETLMARREEAAASGAAEAEESDELGPAGPTELEEAATMREPVIVDVVRTTFGKRGGALANWHPADLLGFALTTLLERTGRRPRAHRRRHRRVREPGGGAEHQRRPQRLGLGRTAPDACRPRRSTASAARPSRPSTSPRPGWRRATTTW